MLSRTISTLQRVVSIRAEQLMSKIIKGLYIKYLVHARTHTDAQRKAGEGRCNDCAD